MTWWRANAHWRHLEGELLREFMAADLDGNLIRVFYDVRLDV